MISIINIDKICRICRNDILDDLISPCDCKGSSKYVHRKCLDIWRTYSQNLTNFNECNVCKFKYLYENSNKKKFYIEFRKFFNILNCIGQIISWILLYSLLTLLFILFFKLIALYILDYTFDSNFSYEKFINSLRLIQFHIPSNDDEKQQNIQQNLMLCFILYIITTIICIKIFLFDEYSPCIHKCVILYFIVRKHNKQVQILNELYPQRKYIHKLRQYKYIEVQNKYRQKQINNLTQQHKNCDICIINQRLDLNIIWFVIICCISPIFIMQICIAIDLLLMYVNYIIDHCIEIYTKYIFQNQLLNIQLQNKIVKDLS
jgi:hypothetical protein